MKENLMEIDRAKEPYTYITISSLEKMGKQIDRLQEQLKEANEVIQKDFDSFDYIHSHIGSNQSNYNALMSATSYAISDIREYLKKWGVK